jgi:chorismate mutase
MDELTELRDRVARLEEVVRLDLDERVSSAKRVRDRVYSDPRIEETVTRRIESAGEVHGYDPTTVTSRRNRSRSLFACTSPFASRNTRLGPWTLTLGPGRGA